MFFQMEAEQKESRSAYFRYVKNKYLQFVAETKAYYPELAENPRFYLARYWEADALIRFNKWLLSQDLTSKSRYSVYKAVRQVMDMAYALRVIETIVYHAPMFKGVRETKQRAAYTQREQEIVNAAIAKWIGLALAVVNGYQPTGEGIPYRKKDFDTTIEIDGHTYRIADAARAFRTAHGLITQKLIRGWTPRQAVGIDPAPSPSSLEWTLEGVHYHTVHQVAEAFGLSENFIKYRIRRGWSPEQIVGIATKPRKNVSNVAGRPRECTVEGRKFKSLKDVSEHYGVRYSRLKVRLSCGWTLREALGLDQREAPGTKVTVEGVEYKSLAEVSRAYGLSTNAVRIRLRKGLSPEQAVGLLPIHVPKRDERALLWMFENEFGCNAYEMLSHFYIRKQGAGFTEKRLLKLFSKWGVWPYVDDRLVMPLAMEMAMLTGLNVEALKDLNVDSYQVSHRLTGQPVIVYHKKRSGSSVRSEDRELHIGTLEFEELYIDGTVAERVHKLIMLILAITSTIRKLAPPGVAHRLFIFEDVEASRREGKRVIVPIDPRRKAGHWYRRFCTDEGFYQVFGPRFNFNISRCRPTLATNMVLAGADIFQVQAALGHESIQTTATYLDEMQLRPAFNKTVSEALEGIALRSRELQQDGSINQPVQKEREGRNACGFHETLSGCGCTNPYAPSDGVKKATKYKEGTVCKYWNMCLLCDSSVVTEQSLPKLILYRNRVAAALESDTVAIQARKLLYRDAVKLIDGIVEPDVIFPGEVIDNAKHVAATMDDLLVDHLIYQGI